MSINLKADILSATIAPTVYVKQHPYVGDDGIYMPVQEYVPNDCCSEYRMILSKEMFIEAYNKWIKGE